MNLSVFSHVTNSELLEAREIIFKIRPKITPFSNKNYAFKTENSVDISDEWIRFSEKNLSRVDNQLILSRELLDINIALNIELSILEYTLIYCANKNFAQHFIKPIYDDKFDSIIKNIICTDGINNRTFKNDLINKKIESRCVGFLSPQQIHPDNWKQYINKNNYIEEKENKISYSTAYPCIKCGESKAKITQSQTRGADEPMTTFVSCLVCKTTHKFC